MSDGDSNGKVHKTGATIQEKCERPAQKLGQKARKTGMGKAEKVRWEKINIEVDCRDLNETETWSLEKYAIANEKNEAQIAAA